MNYTYSVKTQPKFILIQTVRYVFRPVLCLALSALCICTDTHFLYVGGEGGKQL